eukprot:3790335-Rhodomonas_salina.2
MSTLKPTSSIALGRSHFFLHSLAPSSRCRPLPYRTLARSTLSSGSRPPTLSAHACPCKCLLFMLRTLTHAS